MNPLILLPLALISGSGPVRLRTILPNGSVILAEQTASTQAMSVQLFVNTQKLGENSMPKGAVHLLEHLLVQRDPFLDSRAEREGLFFLGRTYRDALQVEISGNPNKLDLAIEILKEIVKPLSVTAEQIRLEAAMIEQERATLPAESRLGTAAWVGAFGGDGYDPIGDPAALATQQPEQLGAWQSKMFTGRNLVLAIAGPLDCDEATAAARTFLEPYSKGERLIPDSRPVGASARVEVPNVSGEVRAAIVPGIRDRACAAALAAGLAIASQQPSPFFTYTPTTLTGLMIIGQTDRSEGIGLFIDEIDDQTTARIFPLGKSLAEGWVRSQLEEPEGIANFRGILLSQGASNNPEDLIEMIKSVTWSEFKSAVELYKREIGVTVVGA